ncbi:MAG TPA: oligosaccharide flippase family protein, partial [Acidimicrobiales bacterium]|nr:oligosaccharide flippase family protein [Acidimicrobiales bacterium]
MVATRSVSAIVAGDDDGVLGRVARSGVWLILAHIATAGAAFVVSVVVARRLGTAEFGRYSFFFFLVSVIPTLVALGIPPSIARTLPERIGAGDHAGAFAVFRYAIRRHAWFLPPAVVGAAVVSFRSDSSWLPAVVVCGATVGVLLGLDYEALLTALRRFRSLAFISFGTAVAQVVAIGLGALADVGWRGFLALQTAALVGGAIPVAVLGLRAMATTPKVPASPENRRTFKVYARQQAFRLVLTTVLWGRPELLFLEA